jgi:hypothetical protein
VKLGDCPTLRDAKGVTKIEQLNIGGKRSGDGFVAHKAMLTDALSRAVSDRVILLDFTVGRKGLLGYLKALSGNVVKVTPNGIASETQDTDKRLKVVCGDSTGYLSDSEWIDDNTPVTICQVKVCPSNSVKPNVGATELADVLARVLPFVAKEDTRPVLQCVNFVAKDGKLTLVGADGYRLAIESLDYDDVEGQALITLDDLKGMVSALRRAKRARVSFEKSGENLDGESLVIDTELIRYKWIGYQGSFPDYDKLIPTESNTVVHFDTVEALKAVNALKALSGNGNDNPVDLTIGNGKIVMASPEDKGQAELMADAEGEGKVRLDGGYLAQALKACGGMVDLKLTNGHSPVLFAVNGYRLVVMPMLTADSQADAKVEAETQAQAEAETESTAETEPTETPAEKPKARRSRAKEPVAVK